MTEPKLPDHIRRDYAVAGTPAGFYEVVCGTDRGDGTPAWCFIDVRSVSPADLRLIADDYERWIAEYRKELS